MDDLNRALAPLDRAPLECDGMTHVIAFALSRAGVPFNIMAGQVVDLVTGCKVFPHYWIDLDDGWLIDFRLRYWLGSDDRIPHGVFRQPQGILYNGKPQPSPVHLSEPILNWMSNGILSDIRIPERHSHAS